MLTLAGCASDPYPEDKVIVLCYKTLADVQCYDQPDAHRDDRLVGFYLKPADEITDNATALEWAKVRAKEKESE